MAYKIVKTRSALQDLEHILGYMTSTLADPGAASAFADKVEDCYTNLEQMPMMYGYCHDSHLRAWGYHKAVIKNHIMIYKVDEEDKTVIILRFFYSGQDYERLI